MKPSISLGVVVFCTLKGHLSQFKDIILMIILSSFILIGESGRIPVKIDGDPDNQRGWVVATIRGVEYSVCNQVDFITAFAICNTQGWLAATDTGTAGTFE